MAVAVVVAVAVAYWCPNPHDPIHRGTATAGACRVTGLSQEVLLDVVEQHPIVVPVVGWSVVGGGGRSVGGGGWWVVETAMAAVATSQTTTPSTHLMAQSLRKFFVAIGAWSTHRSTTISPSEVSIMTLMVAAEDPARARTQVPLVKIKRIYPLPRGIYI